MLKQTMYGRAGFQFLRARVLHAARPNEITQSAGEPENDPLAFLSKNISWSVMMANHVRTRTMQFCDWLPDA